MYDRLTLFCPTRLLQLRHGINVDLRQIVFLAHEDPSSTPFQGLARALHSVVSVLKEAGDPAAFLYIFPAALDVRSHFLGAPLFVALKLALLPANTGAWLATFGPVAAAAAAPLVVGAYVVLGQRFQAWLRDPGPEGAQAVRAELTLDRQLRLRLAFALVGLWAASIWGLGLAVC